MEATGFYRVPHFVDAAKVEELNAKIDLWFETFAATEGYSPSKFQFFDLDPFFIELMAAPLIIKIGSHFLGEAFRFDHPVGLQQPGRLKLADGSFFVVDAEHGDLHGGPASRCCLPSRPCSSATAF